MVVITKECLRITFRMELESSLGMAESNTKDTGEMESKMDKEHILLKITSSTRECGKKGNASTGYDRSHYYLFREF